MCHLLQEQDKEYIVHTSFVRKVPVLIFKKTPLKYYSPGFPTIYLSRVIKLASEVHILNIRNGFPVTVKLLSKMQFLKY
jgi:hypothetical protein